MFKMLLTAAATMVAAAAPLPALAATPGGANTVTASADTPAASAGPNKPSRYCVAETFTGSHVIKKTCLTRDEWLKRGFDPLQ